MKVLGYILGVIVLIAFIYGSYWVVKTVSYSLFYKDMVIKTIHANVKPECVVE